MVMGPHSITPRITPSATVMPAEATPADDRDKAPFAPSPPVADALGVAPVPVPVPVAVAVAVPFAIA